MNSFQKSLVIAVASLGVGSAALAASDSRPASPDGGSHWGAFGWHGANFAERAAYGSAITALNVMANCGTDTRADECAQQCVIMGIRLA